MTAVATPETLPTGKLLNVSNDDYHAADALSHSKLEVFRERPSLYYKRYVTREIVREETRSLLIGHATHCAIMEGPKVFESLYAVMPDDLKKPSVTQLNAKKPSPETVVQIERWKAWEAANEGKTLLSASEMEEVNRLREAVCRNTIAALFLMEDIEPEVTWRHRFENLGGLCLQCRTDGYIESASDELADLLGIGRGEPVIVDLKTCASLTRGEWGSFDNAVINYGYHRQAAFYRALLNEIMGKPHRNFFFVAVEKQEPYECGVYRLPSELMELGLKDVKNDLAALVKCQQEGRWPGIPQTEVIELEVPAWV